MVHTSDSILIYPLRINRRRGARKGIEVWERKQSVADALAGKRTVCYFPASVEERSPEKREKEKNGEKAIGEVRGVADVPERQRVHPGSLPVGMVRQGGIVERLHVAQRNPQRLDVRNFVRLFVSALFFRFLLLRSQHVCFFVFRHLVGFFIFAALTLVGGCLSGVFRYDLTVFFGREDNSDEWMKWYDATTSYCRVGAMELVTVAVGKEFNASLPIIGFLVCFYLVI